MGADLAVIFWREPTLHRPTHWSFLVFPLSPPGFPDRPTAPPPQKTGSRSDPKRHERGSSERTPQKVRKPLPGRHQRCLGLRLPQTGERGFDESKRRKSNGFDIPTHSFYFSTDITGLHWWSTLFVFVPLICISLVLFNDPDPPHPTMLLAAMPGWHVPHTCC